MYNQFSFLFADPPTTEIYTLSLHDALPIWEHLHSPAQQRLALLVVNRRRGKCIGSTVMRMQRKPNLLILVRARDAPGRHADGLGCRREKRHGRGRDGGSVKNLIHVDRQPVA